MNERDPYFIMLIRITDNAYSTTQRRQNVTGDTRYEIETDIHGERDSRSESEGNLEFNGDDARQKDVT
ncbi:hypothetical protein KUTeg_021945 [Tegillarca granosa]|uniref:Uncharacterized protein n=1 Tax=Tegillarca granosa TaxID=220873 RepID=A0ABQ9E4S9_TEGGR|nr:hypothetical protein KUTeg_021945 [Tegillarca granosa]